MANKSKAKGTKFETEVKNYINEHTILEADRLALSGADDQGDVVAKGKYHHDIVECKAHKKTTRKQIEEWREQAVVECENYTRANAGRLKNIATYPVLIVKEPGQALINAKVHSLDKMREDEEWIVQYLDEYFRFWQKDVYGR